MFAEVTTPRSDHSALVCAAIRLGVATRPMPAPITKHDSETCHSVESWSISKVDAAPSTARPLPISALPRKPMRRYTRPACEAASGQPSVNAPTVRPATSAPVPSTPWVKVGT
ncbi:Uncharacterised protein [Mycobacteroides abscessus subsp. abscessus]|nr:Uncharacterised protein [Mycobacteroides abscessus subsp. abscessus]